MTMHSQRVALPRCPSWLVLPDTGGPSDCPLWEDLQALRALHSLPA